MARYLSTKFPASFLSHLFNNSILKTDLIFQRFRNKTHISVTETPIETVRKGIEKSPESPSAEYRLARAEVKEDQTTKGLES